MKKMINKYCNEKGQTMGEITIIFHKDYVYCEMIEVYEEYRHQGIATEMIDNIRNSYDMPFRYSVVSDTCTGAKFWNEYTKDKKVKCIFGHTFEIEEVTK